MQSRRTRKIGGERYLKNRHENSTAIKLAIHAVNSSRKSLKEAVELKDKLIKEANEEWIKSDKYHASKNTVKRRKPATGLKLYILLENRENHLY